MNVPFRLKKINKKPDFDWCFLFSRKAKCVTKSQKFQIWLQKCPIGNPAHEERLRENTIVGGNCCVTKPGIGPP